MRLPVKHKLDNPTEAVRLNENEPGEKTARYYQKTKDGKMLLRSVMSRYIPLSIAKAVKQGFSAPDASWFRGESMDYVQATLLNRRARIYEYMDPDVVSDLINEHLSGKQNRRLLIWSLLNVEHWCRTFLDGRSSRS